MERSRVRDLAGSPPPTPGLPKLASGSESIRSHRSGKERSERDRERGDRGDRADRDRERERSDRGDRGDRDREREHRSERDRGDRDRERSDRDRGHRSERSVVDERSDRSARDRDRSDRTASSRSATRSRSTNRRGGVQHCEGCKHDIQPQEVADVIKMQHGDYHLECFKCGRCRRPLESARDGREYEGRLLCEKDYQRYLEKDAQRSERPSRSRRDAPSCAGCEGPIQSGETPVYALGQSWHEHHLACYQCKKPIQQSVGHVEKNGRVYCPKDFGELFLPKCRSCNLPVEKEAVCAQDGKLQGKWHAACFGCQTCKKPFPDKSFYVYGDAPYCRRHYHKLNNSLCKSCDQPIEGPCAQTMEVSLEKHFFFSFCISPKVFSCFLDFLNTNHTICFFLLTIFRAGDSILDASAVWSARWRCRMCTTTLRTRRTARRISWSSSGHAMSVPSVARPSLARCNRPFFLFFL